MFKEQKAKEAFDGLIRTRTRADPAVPIGKLIDDVMKQVSEAVKTRKRVERIIGEHVPGAQVTAFVNTLENRITVLMPPAQCEQARRVWRRISSQFKRYRIYLAEKRKDSTHGS